MKSRTNLFRMSLLLLFVVLPFGLYAQSVSVKGVVKDTKNEPIIGASIVQKGTTNGTITDIDGNFVLQTNAQATLVISFVGYKTEEIAVNGRTNLTVTLKEDTEMLDEVVVVGYGVQKKKLVTGATVQMKGEDIEKLNTVSALGALQSQSPGVNIVQSSGMPGEGFKVNVRGMGTIGNAEPLYVIDGVAGGDINLLNPSDIESIDVLKDAASAAIYGARAANGVILVTTKQGKEGKIKVTYDGYYGIQNIAKKPKLLNARQYMEIMDRKDGPTDWAAKILGVYQQIMKGTWSGANWLDLAENKNAPLQNHAVNMAGGSDYSKFSMGLSYTSQDGIIGKPVEPNFERYSVRLNSDHTLWRANKLDIIRFGENLTYSHTSRSGIAIGNIYYNDVHNFLTASPLLPMYDKDGNYYERADKVADNWSYDPRAANPIALMIAQRGMNKSSNHGIRGNLYLEIQPVKDLKFRTNFGYRFYTWSYRSYVNKYNLSDDQVQTIDRVTQQAGNFMGYTWENTLAYTKKFGLHAVDGVLGQSIEKWGMGQSMDVTNAYSVFPGSFDNAYLSNTQGLTPGVTSIAGAPQTEGRLASFFGRVNYNYNEKYMFSATVRADGSGNFARGHRWGYFPSVSAGWVLTNEKFMEHKLSWMDFFKIRASWGQNGNSDIANFQYLSTIAFDRRNNYVFGQDKQTESTGAYANILANKNISWETSEQTDLGFDARFFNSRLAVAFDYYLKTTKDWLVQAPILASYGTGAPFVNGGDIRNEGVELGLTWNDMIKDFKYQVNFNLAYNRNEVTRIANSEGIIHGPANALTYGIDEIYRAQVGYPIGYFYGYKTAGVFQNQQQVDAAKAKLPTAAPGELIFVDTNGDGLITDGDRTMIGNPNPDFVGGFSFNLGYKGFDFAVTTTGAFGQQVVKSYRQYLGEPKHNFTSEILESWNGEGTSNKYPSVKGLENSDSWKKFSDLFVENADYVKVQNITLGYDLKNAFKQLPLSSARIYVTVQNAFTFTGYSGMDPEIGASGTDDNWAKGIDLGFYPSARSYMFGVNLKF